MSDDAERRRDARWGMEPEEYIAALHAEIDRLRAELARRDTARDEVARAVSRFVGARPRVGRVRLLDKTKAWRSVRGDAPTDTSVSCNASSSDVSQQADDGHVALAAAPTDGRPRCTLCGCHHQHPDQTNVIEGPRGCVICKWCSGDFPDADEETALFERVSDPDLMSDDARTDDIRTELHEAADSAAPYGGMAARALGVIADQGDEIDRLRSELDARTRPVEAARAELADELRTRFPDGPADAWSAGWLSAAGYVGAGADPLGVGPGTDLPAPGDGAHRAATLTDGGATELVSTSLGGAAAAHLLPAPAAESVTDVARLLLDVLAATGAPPPRLSPLWARLRKAIEAAR